MTTTARNCPTCGAELPARSTGRPATYCSTPCRQSAHRARQRAQATAARAAEARADMTTELASAVAVLAAAHDALAEPLDTAPAGADWQTPVPTGWESNVAELAAAAARHATTLADRLREHARAAADHRQAMAIAGTRAPADASPSVVNTAAAEDLATQPAPVDDAAAEVDRDALFDAIEDVVYELADTGAGHLLPPDVAEALAAPVDELADVFATASGDGPLDELLTAAGTLLTAAAPVVDRDDVPERARTALVALQAAAPSTGTAAPTERDRVDVDQEEGPVVRPDVPHRTSVKYIAANPVRHEPRCSCGWGRGGVTDAGAADQLRAEHIADVRAARRASTSAAATPSVANTAAAATTKPARAVRIVRHAAPIRRLHADGSECTHKISPSGKPREGQDCPGPAGYSATCTAQGCTWTKSAGIRAIVEEAKRTHLYAANYGIGGAS